MGSQLRDSTATSFHGASAPSSHLCTNDLLNLDDGHLLSGTLDSDNHITNNNMITNFGGAFTDYNKSSMDAPMSHDIAALPVFFNDLVAEHGQPSTQNEAFNAAAFAAISFDASLNSPLGLSAAGSDSAMSSPEANAVSSPGLTAQMTCESTPLFDSPLFDFLAPTSMSFNDHNTAPVIPMSASPVPLSAALFADFPSLSLPVPTPVASTSSAPAPVATVAQLSDNRPRRRKNASVALDDPIEQRIYAVPSKTSRKEMPAVVEKELAAKRARRESSTPAPAPKKARVIPPAPAADPDNLLERPDDQLTDEQLVTKRRMVNTLSARVSRQRKANYVKELEQANAELLRRNKELEALVAQLQAGQH